MHRIVRVVFAAVVLLVPHGVIAQGTTFKSSVDLVRVTAVVRDSKGRLVRNLTRQDFTVIDSGVKRTIADFASEESPVSLAMLFDVSGSMRVAGKVESARAAARHVISWLEPGKDEAALYVFDAELRELMAFTSKPDDLRRALEGFEPYGSTSLHDAIASTAKRVAGRGIGRRAVLVITDGVDTSSEMSMQQVSGVASAIDVPVYILAVVPPIDHQTTAEGGLVNLANWTGGELFVTSLPAHMSVAARQIVSELRHQYLIAFESSGQSGWHPLEILTRDRKLTVRARSGYIAGRSGTSGQLGVHSTPARERSGVKGSPRATEPGSGAEPRLI